MKLSIIIPVYKVEKFLPKCLESLVNQTLEGYELIFVNDGSPDNSQQIIDDYSERYPGLIKSLVIDNGGQGRARNFGIDIAQGEYIGFVDSDDWVDTGMFEALYNAAVDAGADIAVCDYYTVYPEGTQVYRSSQYMEGEPHSSAGLCFNKVFRRSIIEDIRFPEGLWCEDLSFSAKALLRANKIIQIEKALYFYRCGHPSTMRSKKSIRNIELITILKDVKAAMTQEQRDIYFDDLVIDHALVATINRIAEQRTEDGEKTIKILREYVREEIPTLRHCDIYNKQPRNKKIVIWLNYHGMHNVSRFLLAVKKKLIGR